VGRAQDLKQEEDIHENAIPQRKRAIGGFSYSSSNFREFVFFATIITADKSFSPHKRDFYLPIESSGTGKFWQIFGQSTRQLRQQLKEVIS
jgi:hypothetical protein